MKGIFRLIVAGTFAAVLSGCVGLELERAHEVAPAGSVFDTALYQEYVALAEDEFGEGDYENSDSFGLRAQAVGAGQSVDPESIEARSLPAGTVGDLSEARSKLMAAFDAGARAKWPNEAAHAQAMFDCWMEEQEENVQPTDIARCRAGFTEAMLAITPRAPKKMVKPPKEPAPPPPVAAAPPAWPKPFIVFFKFDRDEVDGVGQNVVDRAVAAEAKHNPASVVLSGHADRAGSNAYNQALSERRIQSVRDALVAGGVSSGIISSDAFGEENPRVATPDGQAEPLNRAVQIMFRR